MSETRLATLNEAADLTGLSVDALRKRIKRGRLRAIRGNDGLVRVRLDEADIAELKADRLPSRPASPLDEESSIVRALEAHNETLREQLAKSEERVSRFEARAEKAEARVDELLNHLWAERTSLETLRADSAEERRRLQERIEGLERELEAARAVDAGALHQSAWAGEDSSDAAAEIEKLWQRVAELEHKHDEAGSLPQAMLEAITADLEKEGSVPAPASIEAPEPEASRHDTAPNLPRRWWRRLRRQ